MFWLQKPSILRVCVREEGAGEREAGAPSDLKTASTRAYCIIRSLMFSPRELAVQQRHVLHKPDPLLFVALLICKRVFITNVKGTFFGMSESEEASKRR